MRFMLFSCLPTGHGTRIISTYKSFHLRNTFHKAITALDSDSSDRSGQSRLIVFCKGFTTIDAIKNTYDFWGEVKLSAYTGIWQKLIKIHKEDFEGFKTSVEEVPADVVEYQENQNWKWSLKI